LCKGQRLKKCASKIIRKMKSFGQFYTRYNIYFVELV